MNTMSAPDVVALNAVHPRFMQDSEIRAAALERHVQQAAVAGAGDKQYAMLSHVLARSGPLEEVDRQCVLRAMLQRLQTVGARSTSSLAPAARRRTADDFRRLESYRADVQMRALDGVCTLSPHLRAAPLVDFLSNFHAADVAEKYQIFCKVRAGMDGLPAADTHRVTLAWINATPRFGEEIASGLYDAFRRNVQTLRADPQDMAIRHAWLSALDGVHSEYETVVRDAAAWRSEIHASHVVDTKALGRFDESLARAIARRVANPVERHSAYMQLLAERSKCRPAENAEVIHTLTIFADRCADAKNFGAVYRTLEKLIDPADATAGRFFQAAVEHAHRFAAHEQLGFLERYCAAAPRAGEANAAQYLTAAARCVAKLAQQNRAHACTTISAAGASHGADIKLALFDKLAPALTAIPEMNELGSPRLATAQSLAAHAAAHPNQRERAGLLLACARRFAFTTPDALGDVFEAVRPLAPNVRGEIMKPIKALAEEMRGAAIYNDLVTVIRSLG